MAMTPRTFPSTPIAREALDDTIEDSFPASDPPSSIPDPSYSDPPYSSAESFDGVSEPAGGRLARAFEEQTARMPADITKRLNTEIAAILKQPEVAGKIASQGGEIMGGTAEEFSKFLAADTAAFGRLVKEARISLE